MRKLLVTCFAAVVGLAGWTGPAAAGLFSSTGPVIAILAGDLFQGEAEGHLNGSGTITIHSHARPDVICHGQFTSSAERGGSGDMRCDDGTIATFHFQRLSHFSGHGTGSSSRGSMSFTYGLKPAESEPYLNLPEGKSLQLVGKDLVLVEETPSGPAMLLVSAHTATAPVDAPDALLSAATLMVTDHLQHENNLQTLSPEKIAQLIESTILPLIDFRHMTELTVARHWHLASPEQQRALVAEFRTLLAHTSSAALTNFHEQAISYKPLRMAPGEIETTVRSTVKSPGAEAMSVDYDMEKTPAGWKIFDIRITGISLIASYRASFAETIRESGVDGLIESLAARNRQAESGLASGESDARALLFMYGIAPSVLRNRR
jgi:phospholipid transport system substrate-binding protein